MEWDLFFRVLLQGLIVSGFLLVAGVIIAGAYDHAIEHKARVMLNADLIRAGRDPENP